MALPLKQFQKSRNVRGAALVSVGTLPGLSQTVNPNEGTGLALSFAYSLLPSVTDAIDLGSSVLRWAVVVSSNVLVTNFFRYMPKVAISRLTTQSISINTTTEMTFNSLEFDRAMFTTSGNGIVNNSGYVLPVMLHATVRVNIVPNDAQLYFKSQLDGSIYGGSCFASAGSGGIGTACALVNLAVGEGITLNVWSSDSAFTVFGAGTGSGENKGSIFKITTL